MNELYKYATPAYRKARDKTHLSLQYAGQIERLAAKVFSVKYLNAEKTSAELKLEFGYRSRTAVPGQIFESIAWTDQTWIKEDGEWWYVEPK